MDAFGLLVDAFDRFAARPVLINFGMMLGLAIAVALLLIAFDEHRGRRR